MTIGVKQVARKGFKGYCRSCRKTLKNGEMVAFIKEAMPQRCYHLACSWRNTRLGQQMKSGAAVDVPNGLPADRYPVIRDQLVAAVEEAKQTVDEDAQRQLVWKNQLLERCPVGTRLVHIYDERRVRFVEVVSYSKLGTGLSRIR